jgi:hypothetical protein
MPGGAAPHGQAGALARPAPGPTRLSGNRPWARRLSHAREAAVPWHGGWGCCRPTPDGAGKCGRPCAAPRQLPHAGWAARLGGRCRARGGAGACASAHLALLVQAPGHAGLCVGARQITAGPPHRPVVRPGAPRMPASTGRPRSRWLKALGPPDQRGAWLRPRATAETTWRRGRTPVGPWTGLSPTARARGRGTSCPATRCQAGRHSPSARWSTLWSAGAWGHRPYPPGGHRPQEGSRGPMGARRAGDWRGVGRLACAAHTPPL